MSYILPIFHVLFSYGFLFFLGTAFKLSGFSFLPFFLPLILDIIHLIVVLTVGRNWSRKTLLNCTLIIKYGLIPFYLIGSVLTFASVITAFFPLPFMIFFGIIAVFLVCFGYAALLGGAPYAIAYILSARKERIHSKTTSVLCGICQFFFLFDVLSIIALTLKEHHLRKTTIVLCCVVTLAILCWILCLLLVFTQ